MTRIGDYRLDENGGPWLLPRSNEQAMFFDALSVMNTRLENLGYGVSTGPLVWNRYKAQLKEKISEKK